MSKYTYKEIVKQAKTCKNNIEKKYENGMDSIWCYYFGKGIITPKKDVTKIKIGDAPKQQGEPISRGISRADYTKIAKDLVSFVEKKGRLPNYVTYKGIKIAPHLLTGFLGKCLANELPSTQNINRKWYTKPTETKNVVYNGFVKKTGKKYTTIDDVLSYIQAHGRYIFEFDDVRSNQQVTDCMCGNCTDWLQWLWNMAEAMGYECKCIHVKCRVKGTGHVRGQFKHPKHTGGNWINRDPAAVADGGSITSIWCSDGYRIDVDPSWFMQNLHR